MANGTTPNYTEDQIRAAIQYANPGASPDQLDQSVKYFSANPQFLGALTTSDNAPAQGYSGYGVRQSSTGVQGTPISGMLGLLDAWGGGNKQPQQQAPAYGTPQGGTAAQQAAAANPLSAWGTLGINKVMGQNTPMMINPTPGQTPMSKKSGVAAVSQPTSYDISGVSSPQTSVPSLFTPQAPAATTLGPATASQIKTGISDVPSWQSWYGSNVGNTLYVGGQQRTLSTGGPNAPANAITPDQLFSQWSDASWTPPKTAATPQIPSMTITPAAQPTAAQGATYNPFAQAAAGAAPPPAPGAPANPMAAHFTGLADAGKALYAHFGGDPTTASHADIANFHNELQGAIAGGPPIKRRSGGIVPGTGNQDTVPAMLTPGEYVMNRGAVQRIGPENLAAMNQPQHFQGGGSVQDDEQPREAKRAPLTTQPPSSAAPPPAPGPDATQPSSSQAAPQGTTQGPAGQSFADIIAKAQEARAQRNAPNIGTLAGEQAYVTGEPVSGIPGQATSQAAGAIGGLASGLTAAAQAYADSIKPWIPQKSAIPTPAPQAGPAAQFTQPQAQNPRRQNAYDQYLT
jgi:hypothetical protein